MHVHVYIYIYIVLAFLLLSLSQDLSLDFIFGYRGFDTRQNLFYTSPNQFIYHAAGAGIIYNEDTLTQSFYLEHNDDIVCLALNPNPKAPNVVATGQIGKNGPVHVWDIEKRQPLSILQGAHSVGVCSVDFSHNGKLVVTVGLDSKHSITVWRWAEGNIGYICTHGLVLLLSLLLLLL